MACKEDGLIVAGFAFFLYGVLTYINKAVCGTTKDSWLVPTDGGMIPPTYSLYGELRCKKDFVCAASRYWSGIFAAKGNGSLWS